LKIPIYAITLYELEVIEHVHVVQIWKHAKNVVTGHLKIIITLHMCMYQIVVLFHPINNRKVVKAWTPQNHNWDKETIRCVKYPLCIYFFSCMVSTSMITFTYIMYSILVANVQLKWNVFSDFQRGKSSHHFLKQWNSTGLQYSYCT
jgi:hypothetical protein